ncbi:acylsugar acyltransferase 3-like [Solanum tuberosum]|uniref:acylsugar acyltransferase 3-like n=1 Tax=Solanum tuberosum TaxID=4113 RepID=UPI0003D293F1|nr:PREDICTED: acylsugar acyltransferase 3-like [Solanum tuberosum]
MAFALLSSPSLVSICDKSFIKPSSLTPSTNRFHKLSLVDQSFSNLYIPIAFFYPKVEEREESNNSHELSHIAHLLQTSLSQTLVSYYPYAGKSKDNATIDCNDMGAEFLSARIKCHMSEILDYPNAESIVFPKDLPWTNNYEGGNLLVVQVSKFDCGGIAVSVCLSHKIGDGCSVLNFFNDWASLTRDRATTTLINPSPRFVGDSIFSAQNYGPLVDQRFVSDLNECVQKRLVFPTAKLNALRAKVAVESGVENPTRAEVVSALLFKCATKAASSTTTLMRTSKLVNFFDVRTMMKPRLPRRAIGNVLSLFSTSAIDTNNEQEMKLPKLVHSLRKGVEVAYKKEQVQQNELIMKKGKMLLENKDENCSNVYLCSNLCRYPFYNVDFGWGKPERVSLANGPFKNSFFLMDYKTGQGVEARVMLHKQHMSAFERDKELLEFIS